MLNYLKNYVKKFAMEILPSVAATIIGAYIVNHYIVSKPGAYAPGAAAVSTADPRTDSKTAADGKPVEKLTNASNLPEAGVKARGMSERKLLERSASEKAVVTEKPQEKPDVKPDAKPDTKSADARPTDTPAETASIPADPRRHAPAPREKTAVRVVLPSPVQPITPAAAPVAVTPNPAPPAPPVEAAVAPERDANDLARAAIERLRGSNDNAPRAQQAARTPDAPRAPEVAGVPDTPRVVTAPALRPLPPPIMVSTPANPASDALDQGSQPRAPYANAGMGDPRRPTPPADIPLTRPPLDLRAEAAEPMAKEHTSVAEDMLSAAKSVFHAVLPK
jgi:hypothetical protein